MGDIMKKQNCIAFLLSISILTLVCTSHAFADEYTSHLSSNPEYVNVENTGDEAPADEKKKNSSAVRRYLFLRFLIFKS
jgi:hypothetical protein